MDSSFAIIYKGYFEFNKTYNLYLSIFVFCYLFSLAGALYFAVSPSLVGIGLWDFAIVVWSGLNLYGDDFDLQ